MDKINDYSNLVRVSVLANENNLDPNVLGKVLFKILVRRKYNGNSFYDKVEFNQNLEKIKKMYEQEKTKSSKNINERRTGSDKNERKEERKREEERKEKERKKEHKKKLEQLKKDENICKLSLLAEKSQLNLNILKRVIKDCINPFSKDLYITSEFNDNLAKIKEEYEKEIEKEAIKLDTLNIYEASSILNLEIKELSKLRNANIIEPNGILTIRGQWGNCDSYTYSKKHILAQKDKILEYLEVSRKKKEKRKENINKIEVNLENIAEALYVLNKSAKKSRDTKEKAYNEMNHDIVARAKRRQNKIYEIKDKVICKLYKEKLINLSGYHIQKITVTTKDKYQRVYDNVNQQRNIYLLYDDNYDNDYDDDYENDYGWDNNYNNRNSYHTVLIPDETKEVENKFLYFEICGFGFHIPETDMIRLDDIKFLGDINGLISSEKKIKTKLNFTASMGLLERFLEKDLHRG